MEDVGRTRDERKVNRTDNAISPMTDLFTMSTTHTPIGSL
jgi:hypothetical protein